jgi:hypothetical protein
MTEHPRSRAIGWVLMALAGLAVAVALSVTASNLSTQPIGLAGQPLRAGNKLAPVTVTRVTTVPRPSRPRHTPKPKTGTSTAGPPQSTPAPAPTPSTSTATPTPTPPSPSPGQGDDSTGRSGDRNDD